MHLLAQIAEEINNREKNYKIGRLQNLRKEIQGLSRLPSRQLFDQRTVFENWGWHYGGRRELQFNIGLEGNKLRYGVAFSLECSMSLPKIDPLIPKIALFNEFITEHAEDFSDLRMWHHQGVRSDDYMPSSIPEDQVKEGILIFFGGRQDKDNVNYELILETLDRLLPLYLFTENPHATNERSPKGPIFNFVAGCPKKLSYTTGTIAEKELNIRLKHNDYQHQIHKKLSELYGSDNVGTEIKNNNISIDIVLKQGEDYWFYEIKTSSTARSCIRQALGQILEYSYWPGNQKPKKLIIVGEAAANEDEMEYIAYLRGTFNLPLEYKTTININN